MKKIGEAMNETGAAERYRVEREIGSGWIAHVYAGVDSLLQRPVIIKRVRDELFRDRVFIERFLCEVDEAARLKHPNIVTIYNVAQTADGCTVVMEMCDATTLEALKPGELDVARAKLYLVQALRALAYAHRKGVVHGSLKPSNILFADGIPKLADFGTLRAFPKRRFIELSTNSGDLVFMAPEMREGADADERCDLFSIGALVHQVMIGPPPLDPQTADLSPLGSEFGPIVARLLRRDPAERYASVEELLRTVDPAKAQRGERERPVAILATRSNGTSKAAAKSRIATDTFKEDALAVRKLEGKRRTRMLQIAAACIALIALGLGIFNAKRAWNALHPPAATIPVGRYVGLRLGDAQRAVFVADLDEQTVNVASETVGEGTVMRQDPAPGHMLRDRGVVRLYVSSGPAMIAIPDVAGTATKDAERRLATAGLRWNEIHQYSSMVPAGHIIEEIPGAGNPVRQNYPVRLIVSDGH